MSGSDLASLLEVGIRLKRSGRRLRMRKATLNQNIGILGDRVERQKSLLFDRSISVDMVSEKTAFLADNL